MPFKQTFEQNLNHEMEDDGQPGRAPPQAEDVDSDIKKGNFSPLPEDFSDEKGSSDKKGFNEKQDHPPRFSTLYGVAPAPVPPPPPPPHAYEYQREYYPSPPRARRSGVNMPMPLFILFATILAFESTILFAYTTIGLLNNAPNEIFPWARTAKAVCTTAEHQQPSINIAPNFVIPQVDKASPEASIETVTVSATPSTITISATPTPTTSSTTTSSSTTSSSTSTTSTTNNDAAVFSGILGALSDLKATSSTTSSESVAVVTVTPTRSTVTSIQLITKDAAGSIITPSMVTLTSTTIASPTLSTSASTSATGTITSRSDAGGWEEVSSALEEATATASA